MIVVSVRIGEIRTVPLSTICGHIVWEVLEEAEQLSIFLELLEVVLYSRSIEMLHIWP